MTFNFNNNNNKKKINNKTSCLIIAEKFKNIFNNKKLVQNLIKEIKQQILFLKQIIQLSFNVNLRKNISTLISYT